MDWTGRAGLIKKTIKKSNIGAFFEFKILCDHGSSALVALLGEDKGHDEAVQTKSLREN